MDSQPIPEPLRTVLRNRFNVELFGRDWEENVHQYLCRSTTLAENFRQQFAAMIVNRSVTPEDYFALTNDRYANEDRMYEAMLRLWKELYGDMAPRVAIPLPEVPDVEDE